jgi:hypothetical protein
LRDARRQLEQRRWEEPDPIPRSRSARLALAGERLETDLDAERAGNGAYQAYRAQNRMKDGRRFGGPPNPYQPPEVPQGKVNLPASLRSRWRTRSTGTRSTSTR